MNSGREVVGSGNEGSMCPGQGHNGEEEGGLTYIPGSDCSEILRNVLSCTILKGASHSERAVSFFVSVISHFSWVTEGKLFNVFVI